MASSALTILLPPGRTTEGESRSRMEWKMNVKLNRQTKWSAFAGIALLAAAALPAHAAPSIALGSTVFVERTQGGGAVRSLEPAARLNRGDRVVTIVSWQRTGGAGGFTVTNPLPRSVAYQETADDNEEVSVDGGRTWGQLGQLRISNRFATAEDVTHIRWRVPATLAAQGRGRITYSGIVR